MTLTDRVNSDIKTAMKAKDQAGLRALRAIKSAILLFQTDGSGRELTPELEIQMLQKLVKQRRESLEIYERENREDLAQKEKEEIEVLQRYLPQQLDDEELESALRKIVEKTGAETMRDMGKVMGLANVELAGKAEGKRIAEVVKEILAG